MIVKGLGYWLHTGGPVPPKLERTVKGTAGPAEAKYTVTSPSRLTGIANRGPHADRMTGSPLQSVDVNWPDETASHWKSVAEKWKLASWIRVMGTTVVASPAVNATPF